MYTHTRTHTHTHTHIAFVPLYVGRDLNPPRFLDVPVLDYRATVRMHACRHTNMHSCMHVYIHIHTMCCMDTPWLDYRATVHMHACMHIHACGCTYTPCVACMYACMYACMPRAALPDTVVYYVFICTEFACLCTGSLSPIAGGAS